MGTQASDAIHPGQLPLYTEGDNENVDKAKVPGKGTAIKKPYL